MTQLSALSGVFVGKSAEFRTSYPTNLEPVLISTGVSKGQLRPASGTSAFGTGPGPDRAAIDWNGTLFRVMGDRLVQVSSTGVVQERGFVGGSGYATMDYSFDCLAIATGGNLFYWDGVAFTQVTDIDLGTVVDMIWVDGYFMTTDGKYVVVTDLSDRTSVNPLKYGSAEDDPDSVTGLIRVRGEVYVIGRYTIEVFHNEGGTGFPFAVIEGATIPYGCVSPSAKCRLGASFAFVGSARGESLGVYIAGQGQANKISTRRIDDALAAESDPTVIRMEHRVSRDEVRLFVHLAKETWVFLSKASERAQEPIWYRCTSGSNQPYRIRNAVPIYGMIIVGDARDGAIGVLDDESDSHFGELAHWSFDAGMVYTGGKPFIVHNVELVGLPGRGKGAVFLSLTRDGETYSIERSVILRDDRRQRVAWRPHIRSANYMGFRFRGYGMLGISAVEVG